LEQQLRSILSQLEDSDEIILVDDCSTDETLDIVRSVADRRISVHRNVQNSGVLKTFQRAIELAIGDVIFLSDQDDLWLPGKVVEFMSVFRKEPGVVLALSDAKVINAAGDTLNPSFFSSRGGFRAGIMANVIKNNYLGCTMAFRRRLLDHILPFPSDIPMHDMWIGCVAKYYGGVRFLNVPLISYRRHGNNASPANRQSISRMLVWRWQLAKNLVIRLLVGG